MEKQRHNPMRRVLSCLLVLVMVISLVPAGLFGVNAASGATNIKIHFHNKWGWKTPAIQYWGGSSTTVTGAAGEPQEIPGWGGVSGYTMTQEGDWYTLTLTGDFTGFQFLDLADPNSGNTGGKGYSSYMTQYTGDTAQDLYMQWSDDGSQLYWYTDAACTQELSAPADTKTYTYTVHFSNPNGWSEVNGYAWTGDGNLLGSWPGTAATANAMNAGWYDVTFTTTSASVGLIFNGGGSQTNDLTVSAGETTEVEAWVTGTTANDVAYAAPSDWKTAAYNVTIHFQKPEGWDVVYAYVWDPFNNNGAIPGYEAHNSWPGAEISENATHPGWYDLKIGKETDVGFNFIFNNGGNGAQTGNLWSDTLAEITELWYIGDTQYTTAPEAWTSGEVTAPSGPKANNLVQVQIGESLYTMEVYLNGVYEAAVTLAAGDYTAALVVDGVENGQTTSFTLDAETTVYLRLKDGALQNSVSSQLVHAAALVGNFTGLSFVDENGESYPISAWDPSNANAELTYYGGGLYGRTFSFAALEQDLELADGGYKVAFDDSWDYSVGNGGSNIALTIPAGTTSLTVLVDEINQVVYDQIRTADFEVAQNSGAITKNALTTTVSFIGDARGTGDNDWNAALTGFEFTQISDTLFRYQKVFSAGLYNYKCVFDYTNWYEAEAGNRSFTVDKDNTNVVFLYNTADGKLYDTVNNPSEVAQLLGMEAAPAQMEVKDNANGTTTFIALAEEGAQVTLVLSENGDNRVGDAYPMTYSGNGAYTSGALFLGDEAQNRYYYYEINGEKVLDGSNPTVTVDGEDWSNYTRDAFTGRAVYVPGTFPGPSWDPAANRMTYEGKGLYSYTFANVPAANYEFKIAFGSWAENYGVGGLQDGANIAVAVPSVMDVTVYYNDFSHLAVTTVDYTFADIDLTGTGIPEGTKLTDSALTGIYSATVPMEAGTYTDVVITYNGETYAFAPIEVTEAKNVTFYFDPISGIYYHNASNIPLDSASIYYDSKDLTYKAPYGAVATGEEVTFSIRTGSDATGVSLVFKGLEGKTLQMTRGEDNLWTATTTFHTIGEYDYYFAITNGSSVGIYGDDDGYYGTGVVTDLMNITAYDLVVYQAGFETPDWMKNAVIYQIFPDRFFDGDLDNNRDQTSARGEVDYEFINDWNVIPENPDQEGFLTEDEYLATGAFYGDGEWSNEIYCGDLQGIIERIDYLKALGVNVIYLNPVFSSISSHRYDTSDYYAIDPILGDLGDFTELVEVAEANGMHIILDGVFNHVSDDSIYFDRYYKFLGTSEKIGAYPYWAYVYDYMAATGADQETAEAEAVRYFTEAYGITDYSYTQWFDIYADSTVVNDDGTPAVDNIGLRAGKTVYGYDGWWGYDSMPVVKSTNGSEYQTGNWAEEIIYSEDGSSVTQYWISEGSNGWRLDVANEVSDETWQKFRDSVKALDSDAVIVGEIWTDATKYLLGDMYDSVMNYQFRNAVTSFAMGGSAEEATLTLERIRERYPEEAFYAMMNLVGSHDTSRILSYLDGIGDDRSQTDVASAFPTYENTSDLAKNRQYLVAFTQFTYAGAPTIYYGDEIGMVGADDPDDRRAFTWGQGDKDILTWYATLAAIRSQYSALRTGTVEPFSAGENVLAYVRRDDSAALVVLGNNAQSDAQVTLNLKDLGIEAQTLTDLITGTVYTAENGTITVSVAALRGAILAEQAVEVSVDQNALKVAYDPIYTVETKTYYTVTAASGDHGSISYEGVKEVCQSANATYTFTPDAGYKVANVVVDGVSLGAISQYTFRNVRWNHTISVTFTWDSPFQDVSEEDWYYGAVEYLYLKGLVKGVEEDFFGANQATSRGMIVTMLYRMAGSPAVEGQLRFTDVQSGRYYAKAILWAQEVGLAKGYGDGTFRPDEIITRQELVVFLYRYAKLSGYDVTVEAVQPDFTDWDTAGNYARNALLWATDRGIVQGFGDGTLQPTATVTRAQMAQMLYKLYTEVIDN